MIRAAIAAAALVAAAPVFAQPPCLPHDAMAKRLAEAYGEGVVAMGLIATIGQPATGVMEIFVSPDGSTWTAVVTSVDGKSCIVAAGEAWEDFDIPITPQGDPA